MRWEIQIRLPNKSTSLQDTRHKITNSTKGNNHFMLTMLPHQTKTADHKLKQPDASTYRFICGPSIIIMSIAFKWIFSHLSSPLCLVVLCRVLKWNLSEELIEQQTQPLVMHQIPKPSYNKVLLNILIQVFQNFIILFTYAQQWEKTFPHLSAGIQAEILVRLIAALNAFQLTTPSCFAVS